jgi:CheY-like chemotaxis protein
MKQLASLCMFSFIALVSAGQPVCAQGDPFKIGGGEDPFKIGGPDQPAGRPKKPGAAAEKEDPLVTALKPQPGAGPTQILRSIRLLSEIGRTDLSKKYLVELTKRNLDAKTLVAMMDAEGSMSIMTLIREKELQPEGKELANEILAAAHGRSQNPKYIQSLIAQLKTAQGEQLQTIIGKLNSSQAAAAPPLIKVLADPAQAEIHEVVSYVLTRLGDDMVHPLLATLESKDNELKARVVRVLRYFDRPETIGLLIGPWLAPDTDEEVRKQIGAALSKMLTKRPTTADVRHMLHTYARGFYTGERFVRPDAEDNAIGWRWDEKSQQPVKVKLRARDVGMVVAARLARDLFKIAPDDKQYAQLYLAAAFEVDGRLARAGIPPAIVTQQATAEAVKQGPEMLSELLALTMKSGHIYAARTIARLLGKHGNVDILRTEDARPSPLVRAVKHRDRRLRFAALEAIMTLNPQRPYPGSSYVAEALGFFVGSRGQRRVLVLYGDLNEAQRQAGFLGAAGFDAASTTSPRQAFKMLANSPDYELILMGVAFRQPQISEFLQLLRRDGRTGSLPIGLLVTKDDAQQGERIANRDPSLTHVIAIPSNAKQMRERVAILLSQLNFDPVSSSERTQETRKALDWITKITRKPQYLYRLRSLERQVAQALFDPQLATRAMVALSNLGTPAGQRALVNLASTGGLNIKLRRAAAASFEYSVRRFGLLLDTKQITLQYQRYNKTEHQGAETQKLHAWLLDAIENKAPAKQDNAQQEPAAPDEKARAAN